MTGRSGYTWTNLKPTGCIYCWMRSLVQATSWQKSPGKNNMDQITGQFLPKPMIPSWSTPNGSMHSAQSGIFYHEPQRKTPHIKTPITTPEAHGKLRISRLKQDEEHQLSSIHCPHLLATNLIRRLVAAGC